MCGLGQLCRGHRWRKKDSRLVEGALTLLGPLFCQGRDRRNKQKELNIPLAIRSLAYYKGHLTGGTVVIMNIKDLGA